MAKSYIQLKNELLASGHLFRDTEFPPLPTSIRKDGQVSRSIVWRRPREISSDPKFIANDLTRFDFTQGDLGDCWFVAGAACLTISNRKLFERCVPPDQSFTDDYAGIFRFEFWHFDSWVEVVVDDLLPTINGQLIYAHNREEPNEFWAALLEKAYAKLYGCYDNIDGGHINDALVDFTGGISEVINLKDPSSLPKDFFQLVFRTMSMNSMIGSSINPKTRREEDLGNGLYTGHAYSVTNLIQTTTGSKTVQLIRLRNPWGRKEWKGAWSDGSREWKSLSAETREQIGLVIEDDGEFWMTFNDFLKQFDTVYFCHLYPDALTDEVALDEEKREWAATVYHHQWIKGFNAGGCGNSPNEDLLWSNPQFGIDLKESDDVDADGNLTVVVSLMQKATTLQYDDLYISFFVYKLRSGHPVLLDGSNYDKQSLFLTKRPGPFTNMREVCGHFLLKPGYYVVIPCTFYPDKESDFLLRIYSETQTSTRPIDKPTHITVPSPPQMNMDEEFKKYASGDQQMDAVELCQALNGIYGEEGKPDYSLELSRTMLAMMDRDKSGYLNVEEFKRMLKELDVWKRAFVAFDTDKSDSIDSYELSKVFKTIGFDLSRQVLSSIISRYGGKQRRMGLQDFIHCCCKVVVMYGQFTKYKVKDDPTKAQLSLEDWLSVTMYY